MNDAPEIEKVTNRSFSSGKPAEKAFLCLLAAAVLLLAGLARPASVWAQEEEIDEAAAVATEAEPKGEAIAKPWEDINPQMAAVVYAPEPGACMVGISFAEQRDHEELTAAIERMAKRAEWEIADLRVSDVEGPETEGGGLETSVAFDCAGIVDWNKGLLGIQPFIDEFGNLVKFRVAFILPGLEGFSGPLGFASEKHRVNLFRGEEIYEYEVINIAEASALNEPAPVEEIEPQNEPRDWIQTVLGAIIVVLALAGVVIGWLLYGRMKKSQ